MDEKGFFYKWNNKVFGPVPKEKLFAAIRARNLRPDTPVCPESGGDWKPASELEAFSDLRAQPNLATRSPGSPSPPAPSDVRPWVRYWARHLDLFTWSFLLGVVALFAVPSLLDTEGLADILVGMGISFSWVFAEAALLSTWGTTPGKWLLRITVRGPTGATLGFEEALGRSFAVWWMGLGAGFPIAYLITMGVAHGKLTSAGVTTWDREGGFRVNHALVGPYRSLAAVLFFVGVFVLAVIERMGAHSA